MWPPASRPPIRSRLPSTEPVAAGAALAARVVGGPDRALRVFAMAQTGVVLCSLPAFAALGELPAFLRGLGWPGVPALSGVLAAGVLSHV